MTRKPLPNRSLGTLMTVVRMHIHSGEPVASRTVSLQTKDGLSPASIRNIMMDLEEQGYLEQPHTSAGRVPTEKAYRYYVSQIDTAEPPSRADEQLILSNLAKAAELAADDLLSRTSRVLALVSQNVGVVLRLPVGSLILKQIHFVAVSEKRVLVVVVSPGSQVEKHLVQVDPEIAQAELEAAANYLNDHYRGWSLAQIREDLAARLMEERSTYDGLVSALKQLHENGMLEETLPPEIFLEGASNLIGRPELADPERLRELLRALEAKEKLVALLTECINAAEPLQVVIGLPGGPPLLRDFALIGSELELPGGLSARMAIVGPARMQYERAIRAIGYIGRLLNQQNAN